MTITTQRDRQLIQELALLNYKKSFKQLSKQQKLKVVREFIKIKNLSEDKIENYLSHKLRR